MLHALILHLIRTNQHREALDELETYLTSYPYLLSGPLHTYAGLIAFYLAQPPTLRVKFGSASAGTDGALGDAAPLRWTGEGSDGESDISPDPPGMTRMQKHDPLNQGYMRQARGWFVRALEIGQDTVAAEFIHIVCSPPTKSTFTVANSGTSIAPDCTDYRCDETDKLQIDTGHIDSAASDIFTDDRDSSPPPVYRPSLLTRHEKHDSDESDSTSGLGSEASDVQVVGPGFGHGWDSDGAADEDEDVDSADG